MQEKYADQALDEVFSESQQSQKSKSKDRCVGRKRGARKRVIQESERSDEESKEFSPQRHYDEQESSDELPNVPISKRRKVTESDQEQLTESQQKKEIEVVKTRSGRTSKPANATQFAQHKKEIRPRSNKKYVQESSQDEQEIENSYEDDADFQSKSESEDQESLSQSDAEEIGLGFSQSNDKRQRTTRASAREATKQKNKRRLKQDLKKTGYQTTIDTIEDLMPTKKKEKMAQPKWMQRASADHVRAVEFKAKED